MLFVKKQGAFGIKLFEKIAFKKKKVIIYPIAFTVDNSETEFELEIEYREKAQEMGFLDYRVAKAVNNHPLFVESLKEIYEELK